LFIFVCYEFVYKVLNFVIQLQSYNLISKTQRFLEKITADDTFII
jgi:hypothetical protein